MSARLQLVLFSIAASAIAIPWAATAEELSVTAVALAACGKALGAALSSQSQLQQPYATHQAALSDLAPAQEKLHLASLKLENTDCAGSAPKDPQLCKDLDATYTAARAEVLIRQKRVDDTGTTYSSYSRRYNADYKAAQDTCLNPDLIAAAKDMIGTPDFSVYQDVLSKLKSLVSLSDAGTKPPSPSLPKVNWSGTSWTSFRGRSQYDIRLNDGTLSISWVTDGKPEGKYSDCKLSGQKSEMADCKWEQVGLSGGTAHLVFMSEANGDRIAGKQFDGQAYYDVDIWRDK